MKNLCLMLLLAFVVVVASGCGETFRGIGRDSSRIAYGVKTIFVNPK